MNPKITQFRRQNVWALLGLTIITGTIYWSFWFQRQTKLLNEELPQQRISSWFFPVSIILTSLSILWGIPEELSNNAQGVMLIGQILTKADAIFALVWVFKIRNRLNTLLETSKGESTWLNGVWTFFLGPLYLQFKLNWLHETLIP